MKIWFIIAVMHTTKAVAKFKPEKIQALTGFRPMTSAMVKNTCEYMRVQIFELKRMMWYSIVKSFSQVHPTPILTCHRKSNCPDIFVLRKWLILYWMFLFQFPMVCCIFYYITTQIILVFWLTLVNDLLEGRCTIEVIITMFFLSVF